MELMEILVAIAGHTLVVVGLVISGVQMISKRLDKRFADAAQAEQSIRDAASRHWDERFDMRDRLVDELARRLDANLQDHALLREDYHQVNADLADLRVHLAETYTSREIYIETIAGIHIKLDKLADRLTKPRKPDA